MKTLFICDPGLDYGEYMLFNGLCNVLGEQNVITYPFKCSYYGMLDHGYELENQYPGAGKKGYTKPEDFMVARHLNYWSKETIVENWDEFDLIIMASCRIVALNAARELMKEKEFTQPFVLHESEDYEDIRVDVVNEFKPKLYFKRTLRKDGKNQFINQCTIPIVPFPLSAILNSAPFENDKKKTYSLWYVNGDTHPVRRAVYEKIHAMNRADFLCSIISHDIPSTWYNKIPYNTYMKTIAQSRIAVVPRGWSIDSLKRMEIPIYKTLLFANEIGYVTPNDFEDGNTYVSFKQDLSDFDAKLEKYLKDENECKRIARNGQNLLFKYHTTEARTNQFLYLVKKTS